MRGLVILLSLGILAGSASADSLQVRLIRATNAPDGEDPAVRDLRPELDKKFGFRRYEVISTRTQKLRAGQAVRIDLGEGFVVFATGRPGQPPRADIEWYAGKVSLVKAQGVQGRVLIKGPAVGAEWIILALTLRD